MSARHPLADVLAQLGHPALAVLVDLDRRDLVHEITMELGHSGAVEGVARQILVEAVLRWSESPADSIAADEITTIVEGLRAVVDARRTAEIVLEAVFRPPVTVPVEVPGVRTSPEGGRVIQMRRPR